MPVTIIHCPALNKAQQDRIARLFGQQPKAHNDHYRVMHDEAVTREELEGLREELAMDINTLPKDFDGQSVRLLIMDMDSTLINIECVDEIADFIGVKPQVAAITEAAMQGELDFATSLTRRVSLLQGLDVGVLEKVYYERLQLNPGAQALVSGLQARNIDVALVSGGFTFFTERLKQRLNIDHTLANVLEINDDKLTGKIAGDIVGAEAKAGFLQTLCEQGGFTTQQAIAMGDGANDLLMLGLAGLGVAYHAKPRVREQADADIRFSGLEKVLDFVS